MQLNKGVLYMKESQSLRVFLKPGYKKRVFSELLKRYERKTLCSILKTSSSMLYHYKNNRTKSIPINKLNKIIALLNLNSYYVAINTLKVLSSEQVMNKGLIYGRRIRKNKGVPLLFKTIRCRCGIGI